MKNIQESSGPEIASKLEPTFKRLQQLRDSLSKLSVSRSNTGELERVSNEIKEYLSIFSGISQSFTFGKDKGSIDILFTWQDSYSRDKKATKSPLAERLGMLYNLAAVYNQMGLNYVNTPGDKLKEATNSFLTAAWLFDKIKLEMSNGNPAEFTLDLGDLNMNMGSLLMRAQAQQTTYDKIKLTRFDKANLLAKLAMQAGEYYAEAYNYANTSPLSKVSDAKTFVPLIKFHENLLKAQAYYWNGIMYHDKCKETTEGIGKGVANLRRANNYLSLASKMEKQLPQPVLNYYKDFSQKLKERTEIVENQNIKLYHETIPDAFEDPELMPYGQPISLEAELTKAYEGKEVLANMIPPVVRQLEYEYKNEVEQLMGQIFDTAKQTDSAQLDFLSKHNLPAVLHAVSGEQKIPEDLWHKIKECREKGGIGGLEKLVANVTSLADNNCASISKLLAELKQEEDEDEEMRKKYGTLWNRTPSNVENQAITKQVSYYKEMYDKGKAADITVRDMIEKNKPNLTVLEMNREELTARIPRREVVGEQHSPAVQK
jgi:programmed cell death 6-interacting protein